MFFNVTDFLTSYQFSVDTRYFSYSECPHLLKFGGWGGGAREGENDNECLYYIILVNGWGSAATGVP